MALQGLADEAFCSLQVTVLAEEEFDRVADAVDGAVKIHPATTDLDVGLIDVPLAGDGALPAVEAFQQHWRKVNDPAVDRRMVDADTALRKHLFQIAQAEIVGQVPADTQQDHRPVEMATLEHENPPPVEEPSCPR
ncbi:hypothetical protein MesoLjLc_76650 [Mesorhizobium sp. L-8-10]|nr:hypothetical protein MesoLjLc_76650 [Mesorhizobium sp. L-8-10]